MSMQPGWIQFKFIMIIKMECCCIQLKSLVWFVELCQWVGWFQHQLWLDSFRYANQRESALMLLNWELIESATVRGWMKTAARGTTYPMAPIQIGSIQLRSNGFYRARKRRQCRNLIKRATRRNDKSANLIKVDSSCEGPSQLRFSGLFWCLFRYCPEMLVYGGGGGGGGGGGAWRDRHQVSTFPVCIVTDLVATHPFTFHPFVAFK